MSFLFTAMGPCASHLTSLSLGFCKNKMGISSTYLYQLTFGQENRYQYLRQKKRHLNWELGASKTTRKTRKIKVGRHTTSFLVCWQSRESQGIAASTQRSRNRISAGRTIQGPHFSKSSRYQNLCVAAATFTGRKPSKSNGGIVLAETELEPRRQGS